MPKITDEVYLAKLKSLSLPDAVIAKKLGITEAEVGRKWQALQEQLNALNKNGYNALNDAALIMCHQYQLLGESLKIICGALGNVATAEEIEKAVVSDCKQTIINLDQFIILKPFVPISPEEALKRTLSGN